MLTCVDTHRSQDMLANQHSDGRILDRIGGYTRFWEKDPNQENQTNNENRLGSYTDVVNGASFPLFF